MNNNNNNNNTAFDNKCVFHKESNIMSICSDCKVPACLECIFNDEYHRGHKIDQINIENTTLLFNEFKNEQFPNLTTCLNSDKKFEDQSNSRFKEIDEKHTENLELVTNEFNQIKILLEVVERDTIRQLVTHYDDNKDLHDTISTSIQDNSKNVNLMVNKYKDNINDINIEQMFHDNSQQHIEILKHNHQSKILLNEKKDDLKNQVLFQEYYDIYIKNNASTIKDSIKETFTISKCSPFKEPKRVRISSRECYIYKNGIPIPNGTQCLALGPNANNLVVGSIPNTVYWLILIDGFNQQLIPDILPNSIHTLYIGEIKQPLIKGSIPSSIKYLFLTDGFNQRLTNNDGIIPATLAQTIMGNTVYPVPCSELNKSCIAYKTKDYKHNLNNSGFTNILDIDLNKYCIIEYP